MREFEFVKWVDPEKRFAHFKYMGIDIVIPRSRLIPHLACEVECIRKGIRDVNRIVEICAEKSSVYGFALFRYFLDKVEDYRRKGYTLEQIVKMGIWDRDYDKAYYFKPTCNLLKVRELIAKGVSTEEALEKSGCK